jgi:hypothetical protein
MAQRGGAKARRRGGAPCGEGATTGEAAWRRPSLAAAMGAPEPYPLPLRRRCGRWGRALGEVTGRGREKREKQKGEERREKKKGEERREKQKGEERRVKQKGEEGERSRKERKGEKNRKERKGERSRKERKGE